MGKKVFVLWSDSSRANAHALDDLYERWLLRRNGVVGDDLRTPKHFYPELLIAESSPYDISDLTEIHEYQRSAEKTMTFLTKKIGEINSQIGNVSKAQYYGLYWNRSALGSIRKTVKRRIKESKHQREKIKDAGQAAHITAHKQMVTDSLEIKFSVEIEKRACQDAYIQFLRNSIANLIQSNLPHDESLKILLASHFDIGDDPLFK